VLHRARGVERRRDHAEAPEHAFGAEARAERVEVAQAVEERQDRRVGTDRGCEGVHRLGEVVRLAADDDHVERRAQILLQHERRRGKRRIAEAALDDEAGAGERLRAAGPKQEGDVAARLEKPAAEVTTEGARSHDQIAHVDAPGLRCPAM
jgi:hypothetical protein